ncbi:hypothetical protein SLEP1_g49338 [Rubroshorea leprosula]|uniref:TRAF-type domain-containing protein n=1 Tax=Rubroshorea leprosula TaxID=152421 RepID=A0AAV5LWJ7_9ROSI|nr:hypothetical protein SLEP1_g49338 [Rubroshorea leprosula]
MEVSSSSDYRATQNVELVPDMIEDVKIEDVKEEGPSFYCDLCDAELVRKVAQAFLPGLATACVDNTAGGLFSSAGSVAADIRKEMVDDMTLRSENFVAETVVLEGGPEAEKSDHPFDIISDFVDDFASLKRNLFSRVSGWLLSEKREDRIDDFVQEMEVNGFWLLDKREAIAQTLVKNVDFKNAFHCDKKFNSPEELAEHVPVCGFRSMTCENEGCNARFSANQLARHDSICPFKIIPCEQKCLDGIMRREMDRHCITVCPMKLVNCPFYAVGCKSAVASCMIEKHRCEDLHSHLLYVLQGIHKEASVEDLKRRIGQLEKASTGNLADARDARSLTSRVKNLEAKLGPLEITPLKTVDEQTTDAIDEETTKTAGKDVEEKIKSLEVSAESKDSEEEARETTAKDSEAKLESVEASVNSKDCRDVEETAAKDSEAKLQSVEVSVKNEDSQEFSPTKQESETATELTPNDIEENPGHSEPSATNKSSEEASKTTNPILQAVEN